jgi:hypothetical protein
VAAAGERTQAALKRTRAVEAEQRRLQFERDQLERGKQQTQSTQRQKEYAAQYENQLNQLRPNAMRAYGIKDTPANRQALARHLGNVIQTNGFSGNITRDLVMQAAADLRDEQGDIQAREQGLNSGSMSPQQWQAQRAAGQALPPNRLAAGGGKPMGVTNGAKRGNLSDLEAMVRKGRMGG